MNCVSHLLSFKDAQHFDALKDLIEQNKALHLYETWFPEGHEPLGIQLLALVSSGTDSQIEMVEYVLDCCNDDFEVKSALALGRGFVGVVEWYMRHVIEPYSVVAKDWCSEYVNPTRIVARMAFLDFSVFSNLLASVDAFEKEQRPLTWGERFNLTSFGIARSPYFWASQENRDITESLCTLEEWLLEQQTHEQQQQQPPPQQPLPCICLCVVADQNALFVRSLKSKPFSPFL
jgi:hypothetical protein